jgi:hypothetical protein
MVAATLLALLLLLGWAAYNRPVTTSLADGTTFELASVNVALTNTLVRGTFLGRLAEKWIPANGWRVGNYQVYRPQRLVLHNKNRSDLLVAAIKLRPGSPRVKNLLNPLPHRPLRFQIIGDDGYGYVEGYANFRVYPDGIFAHVVTPSFPRESQKLRFRLEELHGPEGWQELATLITPNPKPAAREEWPVTPGQRLRISDDLEMELGELRLHLTNSVPNSVWVNPSTMRVRFWSGGQIDTNWCLQFPTELQDDVGNLDMLGLLPVHTNGWMEHGIPRSLSPRAVWRFKSQVARLNGFPVTNLFTFQLNRGESFTTNWIGLPVAVSFSGLDEVLAVRLTEKPPNHRLSLVSARTPGGKELVIPANSSNQHQFSGALVAPAIAALTGHYEMVPTPTRGWPHAVEVTIAIHRNYPVQFTIQPKLVSIPPAATSR